MNRILIAVFAVALLCGNLLAQSPQPSNSGSMPPAERDPSAGQTAPSSAPADAPVNPSRIAPGSVIPAQLVKSVDAKKAKKGDEVVARVTADLRNNAGTVIVAKDTKIVGHVTDVQARNKEQKESQVAIAFDHMIPKNGEPMEMPMSIQAIIAPPNRNNDNAALGADQPSSYPGGASTAPGGRAGSTGANVPSTATAPQASGNIPAGTPTGTQAPPQITGNTQGVVGIANLKLSAASDATQGSVVSSEKNNVKLDDGIFLLLRVNQ